MLSFLALITVMVFRVRIYSGAKNAASLKESASLRGYIVHDGVTGDEIWGLVKSCCVRHFCLESVLLDPYSASVFIEKSSSSTN